MLGQILDYLPEEPDFNAVDVGERVREVGC
jgi:hypothetical protein